MPWQNLEQRSALKSMTLKLLNDSRTLWSLNDGDADNPRLEWSTYDVDAQLLVKAGQLLWQKRQVSDATFRAMVHPQVLEILNQSEIFQRLNSPDIVVTKAHQGIPPYRHTINVVESLATEETGLNDRQVFILRLAGYLHDTGKAVSGGISYDEVKSMMVETNHPSNSYPNHDLLSVMVLQAFSEHPMVQEFIGMIGENTWQLLLLLIHNHHFFEFKKTAFLDNAEALQSMIRQITSDQMQLEAFLLTFAFAYADITSNTNYQYLWPEKMEIFEALFNGIVTDFDQIIQRFPHVLLSSLQAS